MGGCLSNSKLLFTTASRSLSFRSHPFHHHHHHHHHYTTSHSPPPPPPPDDNPAPSVVLSLSRLDGGGGFDAAADTRIDFMAEGLDDHQPSHHHHHHQINDSAGTTSKELKQLEVIINPAEMMSNGPMVVRSRSFHTVEEYDALVMLDYLTSTSHSSQTLPPQALPAADHHHHDLLPSNSKSWSSSLNISREADDDEPSNKGGHDDHHYEYSSTLTNIKDFSDNKQFKVRPVGESNSCKDASLGERLEEEEEDQEEGRRRRICHLQGRGRGSGERGSKRKMMAKGLVGSLQVPVPPSLEFTTTVSLRQWLLGGGGGGGGSNYVTPKFGSYNHVGGGGGDRAASFGQPMGGEEEEEGKMRIDPELVAAFEECMQQLEREEEELIKQIEAR